MEIDITQIVVAVIGLLSVIVTSVVVPLIKSKLTNRQCAAHGIKIDADTIQIAIENAWKALGLDQKQLPAGKNVSEAE